MMKRMMILIGLVVIAALVAGCDLPSSASVEEPAAVEADAGQAGVEEPNAPGSPGDGPRPNADPTMGGVNQLAMETLYLQETDYPINADQAATLLPLWESIQEQMSGESPDTAVIDSLSSDIENALSAEQQDLLANLDQETLQTWMQEQGLFGGPGGGNGGQGGSGSGGQPGEGAERPQGTPPADFEPPADFTPPAEGGGAGRGSFGGGPLIAAVIEMLESLQ